MVRVTDSASESRSDLVLRLARHVARSLFDRANGTVPVNDITPGDLGSIRRLAEA